MAPIENQPLKVGAPKEPPLAVSDGKLTEEFSRRLQASRNSFANWRRRAKKLYDTYGGDPWPDEARLQLESTERPVVNFNYALSTINAVVGQDMADRKEAQFQGWHDQDDEDAPLDQLSGELYTSLVRKIMDRRQGHRQVSTVQYDQLITGYGWAECHVDVSRYPFWVQPKQVDCMEMFPDPEYNETNVADGRYLVRERNWTLEDVRAKWPSKAKFLNPRIADWKGILPRKVYARAYQNPGNPSTPESQKPEDEVKVYDYQFRKKEPWVVFEDPQTSERDTMPKKDFDRYVKSLGEIVGDDGLPVLREEIETLDYARDVYYRCYLAEGGDGSDGYTVLEKPKRIREDCFTYKCVTGFRRKEKESGRTKHFGLMDVIYEPQLWSAKTLSSIIEMLGRGAKGGGFIKSGALQNPDKFFEEQSRPGVWWLANDDFDPRKDIHERNPVQWPTAMEKLMTIATEGIPYLTAVTDWVKGTAMQERSNVLISNLQSQAMTVLNPLMDPLSQFRVEMSQLIARMAMNYMEPETINKVVGKPKLEGVTYIPRQDPETGEEIEEPIMVEDPSSPEGQRPVSGYDIMSRKDVLDYHVVVDLGTASVTAKQAIWQLFTQTAMANKLLEDPRFPAEKFFPFLIRNMPGLPAEQAKTLSNEVEHDMEQAKQMQTVEGLVTTFLEMPQEEQQQVMMAVQQAMGGEQPPQAQQQPGPNGGGMPPS